MTVAVLLGASVALAGCSSGSHGGARAVTTPAASSPATTPAAATSAPANSTASVALPTGAIPADLVGTYTYQLDGGTWHVTLRADGTYGQWNTLDELDVTGHYGVAGNLAVFMDEAQDGIAGEPCPGPGSYAWQFTGRRLAMSVQKDDCTIGRIQQWTAGWTKVSSKQLKLTTPLSNA